MHDFLLQQYDDMRRISLSSLRQDSVWLIRDGIPLSTSRHN